jgi:hypothetical protein
MRWLRETGNLLFAVFCWGTLTAVAWFIASMCFGLSQQARN